MTEAAPITSDFFAIYSPDARLRDVAQLAEQAEFVTELAQLDLHLAEHAAVERAAVEQAALTGQWKVRQDTEMLCAALAKAREQLASAEGVALRLAEAAGV